MMTLYHGDCLAILPHLDAGSVDAIIADPPYGTTACAWDSVIPFDAMWRELKRVIKPRGAIVLFGSQPFTSALVMSNPKMFRYEIIWHKTQSTGHLDAQRKPMREHENMLVFANGQHTYNPQIEVKPPENIRPFTGRAAAAAVYGKYNPDTPRTIPRDMSYPRSVLRFANVNGDRLHPTQKPIALLEYLVKTYTNEGDTVLDFTMGSGTTGEACANLDRSFIGIEKERPYYDIAARRIADAAACPRQATLDLEMAPIAHATMEVLL